MTGKKETFLARWSRLKKATDEAPKKPLAVAPDASKVRELPSVESLTADSDFSQFFKGQVEEGLRRAALKKMFQDPHFNAMDGLDVYIDDYSIPDPIPEAMLSQLEHVKEMLAPRKEPEDEKTLASADTPGLQAPTGEQAEPDQDKDRDRDRDS